jgi:hypothetical protein
VKTVFVPTTVQRRLGLDTRFNSKCGGDSAALEREIDRTAPARERALTSTAHERRRKPAVCQVSKRPDVQVIQVKYAIRGGAAAVAGAAAAAAETI